MTVSSSLTPTHSTIHPSIQGLLKDALEVVKVVPPGGGRPRYTIRQLDEELPFDKVRKRGRGEGRGGGGEGG
jgi:hypothetical protein